MGEKSVCVWQKDTYSTASRELVIIVKVEVAASILDNGVHTGRAAQGRECLSATVATGAGVQAARCQLHIKRFHEGRVRHHRVCGDIGGGGAANGGGRLGCGEDDCDGLEGSDEDEEGCCQG